MPVSAYGHLQDIFYCYEFCSRVKCGAACGGVGKGRGRARVWHVVPQRGHVEWLGRFQNCTLMTNLVFVHAAGSQLPVVSCQFWRVERCGVQVQSINKAPERETRHVHIFCSISLSVYVCATMSLCRTLASVDGSAHLSYDDSTFP